MRIILVRLSLNVNSGPKGKKLELKFTNLQNKGAPPSFYLQLVNLTTL